MEELNDAANGYQVSVKTDDKTTIIGCVVSGKIEVGVTAEANYINYKDESGQGGESAATGSLTISKTVTGNAGNKNKYFTFTVKFDGVDKGVVFPYIGSKNGVIYNDVDKYNTVTLKHGESITITGVPADTVYTVMESGNSGYKDGFLRPLEQHHPCPVRQDRRELLRLHGEGVSGLFPRRGA